MVEFTWFRAGEVDMFVDLAHREALQRDLVQRVWGLRV